ncbi:YitT family protein [Lysinibacillus sp. UGB7]|uniref:YitT family protein n=1 Tax=Lysinibacillus sp. UGB7 TaxID=3411039 RepID=UPI003B7DC00D
MTNTTSSAQRTKGGIGSLLLGNIKNIIMTIIAGFIGGVALEFFIIPNSFLDGGITGISIITKQFIDLPLGVFLLIFNAPFIYVAYKTNGRSFAFLTALGITSFAISTSLLHHVKPFTSDSLLAFAFGGVLLGLAAGLAFRSNAAIDSIDLVALLLAKKLPFSVGDIIMMFNVVIFTVAGFVFTWESAMYSALTFYIATKVIDIVQVGFDESKGVFVITDNPDQMVEAISARLGRSSTLFIGEGGYNKDPKKIVYVAITRIEETKLQQIVRSVDPKAFVTKFHISEVHGSNFKENIH